ncbi:hypothetical protein ABK040_002912 [Willaertia magna]
MPLHQQSKEPSSLSEIDLLLNYYKKQIKELKKKKQSILLQNHDKLCQQHDQHKINNELPTVNNNHSSNYIKKYISYYFKHNLNDNFIFLFGIEFFEIIITLTIVLFCVVSFWRSIWELSEKYLLMFLNEFDKNNLQKQMAWCILGIGIIISFFTQLFSLFIQKIGLYDLFNDLIVKQKDKLRNNLIDNNNLTNIKEEEESKDYNGNGLDSVIKRRHLQHQEIVLSLDEIQEEEKNISFISKLLNSDQYSFLLSIFCKIYTFLLAISVILCWKGIWMFLDIYLLEYLNINEILCNWVMITISMVILIYLNTLKSVLSPTSMDKDNQLNVFIVPKWNLLSKKIKEKWLKEYQ